MTRYTLLAHQKDGRQALVQHDNEQAAYLYNFCRQSGVTHTYERVDSDFTVHQNDWVTEYDGKLTVPTIDDIQAFISGEPAVFFAGPEELHV